MSKKLEKRKNRLVRKAENRALIIRRVVQEYRDSFQLAESADFMKQDEKHKEIEEAVARYNEVNKALRRIRKRIQLKRKDVRPAARAFGGPLNPRNSPGLKQRARKLL